MVFSLTSSFNQESMLLTDMFGVVALWFIVFLFFGKKNIFVYVYKPETAVDKGARKFSACNKGPSLTAQMLILTQRLPCTETVNLTQI